MCGPKHDVIAATVRVMNDFPSLDWLQQATIAGLSVAKIAIAVLTA
jgi:hypothetical protein